MSIPVTIRGLPEPCEVYLLSVPQQWSWLDVAGVKYQVVNVEQFAAGLDKAPKVAVDVMPVREAT